MSSEAATSAPKGSPAFRITRADRPDGTAVIRLAGRIAIADAVAFRASLTASGDAPAPARAYVIDLAEVTAIDGGLTALLVAFRGDLERRGARAEILAPEGRVKALVDLFVSRSEGKALHEPPRRIGTLDQIGRTMVDVGLFAQELLAYLGEIIVALGETIRRPASMNWTAVGRLAERAGADGLPIVALISFLMGLILAFQAAVQLRQYGADILVADAVALSITRELGPLMCAIVVAGRSGAAFAAEIGTMKVSEEIDALRTLGLSPYRFLVFPRVTSLLIAMPILTLMGDLVGITGGLLVGLTGLDIPPVAYLLETKNALKLWDVFSGVIKSVAFAVTIGLIACERGLATSGGADGVGRSTTSAVVTSLVHIVALDALFTVLFHVFEA